MMRFAAIALVGALLSGCAAFDVPSQLQAFHPYAMKTNGTLFDINDPKSDGAGYEADASHCYFVALDLKEHLDPERIGSQALQAAGKNGASALIAPLLVAGAAAGASFAETIRGLGLDSDDKKFVFALCMADQARRRGTYVIVDPALKGVPQ